MKRMSEAKLTITIKNNKPVEVTDFTNSFNSLADEYYKFLSESQNFSLSKDTKLYIKEIRSGSIITQLTDLVPYMIPFVEHSNSIMEFTSFVKSGFDYFLGSSANKPKEFDIKDCNNFDNIIKPVAKDNGSVMMFSGDWDARGSTINFNFNSIEANAIQNGISREKDLIKSPTQNIHNNVLFYWDSAKYDEKSKSIDRGYVDSISSSPLKVTFEDQETKKSMLDTPENPFHYLFMVEIEVMTVQGNPAVYKILRINDSFKK